MLLPYSYEYEELEKIIKRHAELIYRQYAPCWGVFFNINWEFRFSSFMKDLRNSPVGKPYCDDIEAEGSIYLKQKFYAYAATV